MAVKRRARRCRRCSLTMIEAVIAIVVVGLMLTAALSAAGAAASARAQAARRERRMALAVQLMTEIFQSLHVDPDQWIVMRSGWGATPFTSSPVFSWPGPGADEITGTRAAFDDVDDYDDWSASPPQAKDGTVLPDLTGWTRSVQVVHVWPSSLNPTWFSQTGLKRITVTVTDDQGQSTTLVGLRSIIGLFDWQPAQVSTQLSWVGVDLRAGTGGTFRVEAGAAVPNGVIVDAASP